MIKKNIISVNTTPLIKQAEDDNNDILKISKQFKKDERKSKRTK